VAAGGSPKPVHGGPHGALCAARSARGCACGARHPANSRLAGAAGGRAGGQRARAPRDSKRGHREAEIPENGSARGACRRPQGAPDGTECRRKGEGVFWCGMEPRKHDATSYSCVLGRQTNGRGAVAPRAGAECRPLRCVCSPWQQAHWAKCALRAAGQTHPCATPKPPWDPGAARTSAGPWRAPARAEHTGVRQRITLELWPPRATSGRGRRRPGVCAPAAAACALESSPKGGPRQTPETPARAAGLCAALLAARCGPRTRWDAR
jgi:hypothetical protein